MTETQFIEQQVKQERTELICILNKVRDGKRIKKADSERLWIGGYILNCGAGLTEKGRKILEKGV